MSIKDQYRKEVDQALKDNQVFFAFSNERFNKHLEEYNISKDTKITSAGAGAYLPSANVSAFNDAMSKAKANYKKAMKQAKAEKQESAILYELNNYECFYTGDISDAVDAFKGIFTYDQVMVVYNKYKSIKYQQ